jgi:small-conductance mechanosensitive channel
MRLLAAGLWLLVSLASATWAELPGLGTKAPPAAQIEGGEAAAPSPEMLEQALAATREQLQSFQALLEATPAQQFGATDEEAAQKAIFLTRQVLAYDQHIHALRELAELGLASQDLATKMARWEGFGVAPPYPLSLLDELRDSISAQNILIEKDRILQSFAQQDLERASQALKEAQQRRRQVAELIEKPALPGGQLRREWLEDLARQGEAAAQVEILSASARQKTAEAALALHGDKLAFLERQLGVANATPAVFSQAELEKKLAAVATEQQRLEAEQLRVSRESALGQERLQRARQELQRARAAAVGQAEIEQLQEVLELRQTQFDNLALKVEFYKIRDIVLQYERSIWEERYRVAQGVDTTELGKVAERLRDARRRLEEYRSYLDSNLKLAQNLALNQRQRLAELAEGAAEGEPVQQRLDSYIERTDFLLKALGTVDDLMRLQNRFIDEIEERMQQARGEQRLQGLAARGWELARRLWNYEIFIAEDTVLVGGQKVTKERPVTTGKVAVAVAILVVGLWLVFLLRDRTRSLAARYLRLEAGAAVLVEKILTAVVVTVVFVFALITVKIPLTIFAFMGGALAIGVGFGAQNLINNFISGMILLFERPIKVGDVVEVDGNRGRVIEIGARCSQVRRFDGFDMLVPNSEFLQKSVINLTLADELIRLNVRVGVAYGSPTREVVRIMDETMAEHGRILKQPEPLVLFEDFGDSALIFSAYFWAQVSPSYDYRIIESDYRHMLDHRFGQAGIEIAFPQLNVHVVRTRPVRRPESGAEQSGSPPGTGPSV